MSRLSLLSGLGALSRLRHRLDWQSAYPSLQISKLMPRRMIRKYRQYLRLIVLPLRFWCDGVVVRDATKNAYGRLGRMKMKISIAAMAAAAVFRCRTPRGF